MALQGNGKIILRNAITDFQCLSNLMLGICDFFPQRGAFREEGTPYINQALPFQGISLFSSSRMIRSNPYPINPMQITPMITISVLR